MNTNHNNSTIHLNTTFVRIINGAATIGDVLTERTAARSARLANEDAYTRRRREWAGAREQFTFGSAY